MKIYISYRRVDTAAQAGRLADVLVARFGVDSVFKDVDSIPVGQDFHWALQAEIEQAEVILALIGREWLQATDASGHRRLDDPNDFVRAELEMALSQRIPIVPVLVDGATMPSADALPQSLRELAFRNAVSLRPDPDYHRDIDRLIRGLEELVEASPQRLTHEEVPDVNVAGPPTVFVSHSSQDRKWVEKEIVAILSGNGIKPWYSKTSISTASQWEREILRGLESCDWFLLVVSPRAARSEWVKDELNWAVYNRPTRIVPVIMQDCNLWDFHIRLPRIQNIDFTHDLISAQRDLVAMFRQAS